MTFETAPEDYDTVLVGSSPLSILEALYRDGIGKKVLMVEADDHVGGVWAAETVFGIKGVERYSHVLTRDEEGMRGLETLFPETFMAMEREPDLIICDGTPHGVSYRYPMRSKAARFRQEGRLHQLDRRAVRSLYSLVDWYDRNMRGLRHIFPRTGFGPIIAALEEALERSGVDVWLDTRAKALASSDREHGGVSLQVQNATQAGRFVNAGQAVLTSRTLVETITIGAEAFAYGQLVGSESWFQFILLVEPGQPSRYTYTHIVENPLFRRASNLSREVRRLGTLSPDRELHLVTLVPAVDGSHVEGPEVLEFLKSMKLIDPESRLLDWRRQPRRFPRPDIKFQRELMKKSAGNIDILISNDFSRTIGANWRRWTKAVAPLKVDHGKV